MPLWSRLPDNTHAHPVTPRPWPLIGHQAKILFDPLPFLRARAAEGPFCWLDMGMGPGWTLFLLHTDGYKMLRSKTVSVGHYAELVPALLGQSLLTRDGAEHRRMRSAMNAPFTPKGLDAAGVCAIIDDVMAERLGRLAEERSFVALEETRELALDIIFRIIGIRAADIATWRTHYEEVLLSTVPLRFDFPGSPHRRATRGRAWVSARLAERIAEVRADGTSTGLLADMVRSWDAAGETEDAVLIDNVLLLVLAGHETTASTMAWITCHLAADGALWERLVEESNAAPHTPRTPAELAEHPFAEGLFRECLRMFPPVPNVSRLVVEPMELDGVTVDAGTHLNVPIVLYGRDRAHYPEPERFRPERWVELGRRPSPLENLAFSFGPHFCLGYHIAMAEGIQYGVALARALSSKGLRPTLAGAFPSATYFGLCHPRKKQTKVLLESVR